MTLFHNYQTSDLQNFASRIITGIVSLYYFGVPMALNTHFDELLDFPCVFAFKVMGIAGPELLHDVLSTIQKNAPGDYAPTIKPSSKGTYNSLSIPVTVTSKEQIESIYNELNKLESVRYIL